MHEEGFGLSRPRKWRTHDDKNAIFILNVPGCDFLRGSWGEGNACAILSTMDWRHIPWHLLPLALKLLAKFGLIPVAAVGIGMKKLYQKRRQSRAASGWPSTDATVQGGKVQKHGPRHYWVELTYTYFVEEYRTGTHVHRFRKEDEAEEFLRQVKDKRIQVRYNPGKPGESAILDRDLEMVVMLSPLRG